MPCPRPLGVHLLAVRHDQEGRDRHRDRRLGHWHGVHHVHLHDPRRLHGHVVCAGRRWRGRLLTLSTAQRDGRDLRPERRLRHGRRLRHTQASSTTPPIAPRQGQLRLCRQVQEGSSAPEGETEFQCKVCNINFHSTSLDWLLVSTLTSRPQRRLSEGVVPGLRHDQRHRRLPLPGHGHRQGQHRLLPDQDLEQDHRRVSSTTTCQAPRRRRAGRRDRRGQHRRPQVTESAS